MRRKVVRASAILPAVQHGKDPFPHLMPGDEVSILKGQVDLALFCSAFEALGYEWVARRPVQVGGQTTDLHIWHRRSSTLKR